MIELKTRYHDQDYLISDRVGNDRSITINGKHYGVEVRGRVFDHLSPQEMKREDWLKDFHCQSEEFISYNFGIIARLVIQVKPSIRDSIELDFDHLGEANYDRV